MKPNQVLPMFPWVEFHWDGVDRCCIAFVGEQAVIAKVHDEPGLSYRVVGMLPVIKIEKQLPPTPAWRVRGHGEPGWDLVAEGLSHPYGGTPSTKTLIFKLGATARDALLKIVSEYLEGYRPIYVGQFGPRECVNQFGEVRYDYGLSDSPSEHWKTVAVRKTVGSLRIKRTVEHLMVRFDGTRIEEHLLTSPFEGEEREELKGLDVIYDIRSDGDRSLWGWERAPSSRLVEIVRELKASTGAYLDELLRIFFASTAAVSTCDLSPLGRYNQCAIVRPENNGSRLAFHRYDLDGNKIGDGPDSTSIASFLSLFWRAVEKRTVLKLDGDVMFTVPETKLLGTFLFGALFD